MEYHYVLLIIVDFLLEFITAVIIVFWTQCGCCGHDKKIFELKINHTIHPVKSQIENKIIQNCILNKSGEHLKQLNRQNQQQLHQVKCAQFIKNDV